MQDSRCKLERWLSCDYAVEEAVAGGLKKLGLDPATIRYAVVTHPHPDHHGGAKFLQDRYRTRVVSKLYLPQLAKPASGRANPYVVGNQAVRRYLEVARECATARLLRIN